MGETIMSIAPSDFLKNLAIFNVPYGHNINPPVISCYAASTANLTGYTYLNGAAGIGATLTAPAAGVFTIDGTTPSLNDRILYKDDTTGGGAYNGIYTVSTLGTVGVAVVLTRAADYDTPTMINNNSIIPVINGTANANTGWINIANVVTVGVTAIVYVAFGPFVGILSPAQGGTGINNGASTITIAGAVQFAGAHPFVGNLTGSTNIIFPTAGTLAVQTQIQQNAFNFGLAAGSGDAYTVTLSPVPGSYTDGMPITLFANRTNTTNSPTINVNGLGAINIVTVSAAAFQGSPLIGDIQNGNLYELIYNSADNTATLLNPSLTFASAPLVQENYYNYTHDTGASNVYVAALPLDISNVPVVGAVYTIKMTNANTGASTMALNGSGPYAIIYKGSPLVGGEIAGGQISQIAFNGTDYELLNSYANFAIMQITTDDGDASGSFINLLAQATAGSTVLMLANDLSTITLNVTDKSSNTILGLGAGNLSVSGENNAGFGSAVLAALLGGNDNAGVGASALTSLTSGSDNTAVGFYALGTSVSDSQNCAFGAGALSILNGGNYNIGVGAGGLGQLATGSYNLALGNDAGNNYNSSETGNILLNNPGTVAESHVLRIGSGTGTSLQQLSSAFISGINGVTNTSAKLVTINSSTDQLGVVASVNNGLVVTNGSGIPSVSTTLPNGLAMGTPASLTLTNALSLPVGGITATGTPSSSTFLRGDGSWQSVTAMGAVLLSPSGDQTILNGYSLIVTDAGNIQADSGNLITGSPGLRGHLFVYPPTSGMGVFEIAANDSAAMYDNVLINGSTGQSTTWTLPDGGQASSNIIISDSATGQFINSGYLQVNAGNIYIGGGNGLVIYPGSPSSGLLTVKSTANGTGNFATTITNLNAIAQNQTISVPDCGSSASNFLLSSIAGGTQHITGGSLQIDAGNVTVGGGNVYIAYPSAPTSGQFIWKATTNTTGNFNTVVTNAAAIAQSQTISVPDCGFSSASFILSTSPGIQNIDALAVAGNPVATETFGTFSPVVRFGGNSVGITYSYNNGWWDRIGNVITFSVDILLTSKGSSTGAVTIAAMPFTARVGVTNQNVYFSANGLTFSGGLIGSIYGSQTQINLYNIQSPIGALALDDTAFSNTTEIFISGTILI